jgi:hypothetical protein
MHLLAAEPGEIFRLAVFRAAHPEVIIGDGGFGMWQAQIPEENGETVTTRYTLRELLDRLDTLTAGRDGQSETSADKAGRTRPSRTPCPALPAVPGTAEQDRKGA